MLLKKTNPNSSNNNNNCLRILFVENTEKFSIEMVGLMVVRVEDSHAPQNLTQRSKLYDFWKLKRKKIVYANESDIMLRFMCALIWETFHICTSFAVFFYFERHRIVFGFLALNEQMSKLFSAFEMIS